MVQHFQPPTPHSDTLITEAAEPISLEERLSSYQAVEAHRERAKFELLQNCCATIGVELGQKFSENTTLGTELYNGLQTEHRREVVAKFYLGGLSSGVPEKVTRADSYFEVEVQALQNCLEINEKRFPNEILFTPLLGTFHSHGVKGLIMEHLPFRNGSDVFLEAIHDKKTFTEAQLVNFLTTGLMALSCLQNTQSLHRDISPRNLLIQESGKMTLLDLNTAKPLNQTNMTTLEPEHFYPRDAYGMYPSLSIDGYALGIIGACLFTGKSQYELRPGDDFDSTKFGLPVQIGPILNKLCATKPEDRFATAAEALEALQSAISIKPQAKEQIAVLAAAPVNSIPKNTGHLVKLNLGQRFMLWLAKREVTSGYLWKGLELLFKIPITEKTTDVIRIAAQRNMDVLYKFICNGSYTIEKLKFLDVALSCSPEGECKNELKRLWNCYPLSKLPISTDAFQYIKTFAASEEPRMKMEAAKALFNYPPYSDSFEVLKKLLGDVHSDVRLEAAKALPKFPPSDELLKVLKSLAGDTEWRLRALAARLIGQFPLSEDVQPVFKLLSDDETPLVVNSLMDTICAMPASPIAIQFIRFFDFSRESRYLIEHLPISEQYVELLSEYSKYKNIFIRSRAASALCKHPKSDRILDILKSFVDAGIDPDELIIKTLLEYPHSSRLLEILDSFVIKNPKSIYSKTIIDSLASWAPSVEILRIYSRLASKGLLAYLSPIARAVSKYPPSKEKSEIVEIIAGEKHVDVRSDLAVSLMSYSEENDTDALKTILELSRDAAYSVRQEVANHLPLLAEKNLEFAVSLAKELSDDPINPVAMAANRSMFKIGVKVGGD